MPNKPINLPNLGREALRFPRGRVGLGLQVMGIIVGQTVSGKGGSRVNTRSGLVPPEGTSDPVAETLRMARQTCAAFFVLPALFLFVLVTLDVGMVPLKDPDPVLLVVFSAVGLVSLATSVTRHRHKDVAPRDPRYYSFDTIVDYALGEPALLLGFVAAIIFESLWPFLVSVPPVLALWVWAFPREATWRRWESLFTGRPF